LLDLALERWEQFKAIDLARVNSQLRIEGVAPIDVKVAP
jgi:hypothetical protein